MSDTIDDYRALKDHHRELRHALGIKCPGCQKKFPKANPKILLPSQRCFCGYKDERPYSVTEDYYKEKYP